MDWSKFKRYHEVIEKLFPLVHLDEGGCVTAGTVEGFIKPCKKGSKGAPAEIEALTLEEPSNV